MLTYTFLRNFFLGLRLYVCSGSEAVICFGYKMSVLGSVTCASDEVLELIGKSARGPGFDFILVFLQIF